MSDSLAQSFKKPSGVPGNLSLSQLCSGCAVAASEVKPEHSRLFDANLSLYKVVAQVSVSLS